MAERKLIELDASPERKIEGTPLRKALPFFRNPRGYLVHRVRRILMIRHGGVFSHFSIGYHCGNFTTQKDLEGLLSAPDSERHEYLCIPCEMRAIVAGKPVAASLAGKTVKLGRVSAGAVEPAEERIINSEG